MNYIDLSHTFKGQLDVFPGDSPAKLEQVSFFEKDGYNSFYVQTGMHVGTHMDAPFHMLPEGKKLTEFPPEKFIGRGRLIQEQNDSKKIDVDLLKGKDIREGDIVLVDTGHYKKFGTADYYKSYPEITIAFADYIISKKVKILALDFPSPDGFPYKIHKALFENEILIIENLTNLATLHAHGKFKITALPAKFEAAGAPVRVVAELL